MYSRRALFAHGLPLQDVYKRQAPLCTIARGKGDQKEAESIMGNSFILLLISGAVLTVLGLLLKEPLLYAFGASAETFPFADQYITIYLCGSIFVMISLGMNSFINSQGFGRVGMTTVLCGAVAVSYTHLWEAM